MMRVDSRFMWPRSSREDRLLRRSMLQPVDWRREPSTITRSISTPAEDSKNNPYSFMLPYTRLSDGSAIRPMKKCGRTQHRFRPKSTSRARGSSQAWRRSFPTTRRFPTIAAHGRSCSVACRSFWVQVRPQRIAIGLIIACTDPSRRGCPRTKRNSHALSALSGAVTMFSRM